MKKILAATLLAAIAAASMTGCKDKLDGKYDLCNENGDKLATIEFEDEDFKLRTDDQKYKGDFEIIENGKIDMNFKDDDLDDNCGGKQSYKLFDKTGIYIEDVSAEMENQLLKDYSVQLYKAINSVLVDLDELDELDTDYFLYSTNKDYISGNVSDDFAKTLDKNIKNYFDDYGKYDFIARISYGSCGYAVAANGFDSKDLFCYDEDTLDGLKDDYGDTLSEIGGALKTEMESFVLYEAFNDALDDLDFDEYPIFLFSSDDSYNTSWDYSDGVKALDSSFISELDQAIREYYEDYDNCEFVALMSYGECVYLFSAESFDTDDVYGYPENYVESVMEEADAENLKDIAEYFKELVEE